MNLTEDEQRNIREGDIVLVPMRVRDTNNHFDKGMGVKITCQSPAQDYRPREEREKGPVMLHLMGMLIHSVARRMLRAGDWVNLTLGVVRAQGKIVCVVDDEAVVKIRSAPDDGNAHVVFKLRDLDRILAPEDLTPEELRAFK